MDGADVSVEPTQVSQCAKLFVSEWRDKRFQYFNLTFKCGWNVEIFVECDCRVVGSRAAVEGQKVVECRVVGFADSFRNHHVWMIERRVGDCVDDGHVTLHCFNSTFKAKCSERAYFSYAADSAP